MNNKIKEILDEIKDNINETPKRMFKYNKITFNLEEIQLILDYITNLQESEAYYYGQYKDYKSRNEKAKSLTNRTIEIINQQPSGNDEWILERLNGINYCLGGDEE